ncbi:ETO1-like protein 1 [Oryza brachyantha]|uniref:BTB domain-containing protein n=1 Tax=Oryza brachyantha TaxID=4533 RepID=J3MIZ8_ORYBR|nr:ETO1-like protein 1 [Oryza brachyantha]
MRSSFLSESPCDEQHIHGFNPQSWLQVERGKLPKSSYSPSSIESLIKIAEPPVVPLYKPLDYVEVLSRIHEELEQCVPSERPGLYLIQSQVFRGLGEAKLRQRSLHSAWRCATTVHEKVVFGAWLRYEKRGEDIISDVLASCRKCCREFGPLDVSSEMPVGDFEIIGSCETCPSSQVSSMVTFQISDGKVTCDRSKIAVLSIPFWSMLNGPFTESQLDVVDLSENDISLEGMRAVSEFSCTYSLEDLPLEILLEILVFANTFCCDRLKDACDRKLASFVSSRQDAVELMALAFDENAPVLAASCLQVFLQDLPDCLTDEHVVSLFLTATEQQQHIMVGHASFLLYCFLSEVAMNIDPRTEATLCLSEKLVQLAVTPTQKQIAFHQLGCIRLLRKEYNEAEHQFSIAFSAGHVYSIAGLARIAGIKGRKGLAYEKLSSVITSSVPLGWMYMERSLYSEGDKKLADLDKATELDPTLTYPYMYRATSLMRKKDARLALEEINRLLGFKLALECLELRICLYLALEDYKSAICDIHAILTLSPEYRMLEGRVAASKIGTLLGAHVEQWNTAECWLQLYERWSSVDDIGSLSVIYRMLESDAAKGVLYFRQSLLLLRLNCPEAAMRSLQLARLHAATEPERLVYEGWLLYDTGHCEEALQKAEESISIQRSFEAFFLKAYVLADSGVDPSYSATVISLLEDALKCPSDRLRKGQALNNLGGVYVDCEKLDAAADCYTSALKIRHTRAHQGLARVHFLRNNRDAAYEEMTKLIEKAKNNASAYEKRSEYCEREQTMTDLQIVTQLDPLRVYPYRYRAAVLMDSHKEKEAIAELTRAIAFKADLHLLHLRAAFHEHIGDVPSALRDCRAALSLDPNHQEMLELQKRVNSQEP